MKLKCPVCGKFLRAYLPRGGDGSAFRVYAHKIAGVPCHGAYVLLSGDGKEIR